MSDNLTTETLNPRPPAPVADGSASKINWGGVLKGTAIVTGVVLVGVVGIWAASAGLSWLLGSTFVGPTLAPATEFLSAKAFPLLGGFIEQAAIHANSLLSTIGGWLGIAPGASTLAPAQVGTASSLFGWITGGALAAKAAMMAPWSDIHLTTPTTTSNQAVDTALHSNHIGHTAHIATKLGQLAAENAHDYTMRSQAQASQNWADRVGGPKSQNTSFADRLNADAAKLDTALNEPKR